VDETRRNPAQGRDRSGPAQEGTGARRAAGEDGEAAPRSRRSLRLVRGCLAGGLALLLTAGGTTAALAHERPAVPVAARLLEPGAAAPSGGQDGGSRQGRAAPGEQSASGTQTDSEPATEDESTGVVLVETELGYQSAAAAGTGIVLSDDGLVLTNNHVIEGSTSISVTVATTGETYEATVVGSDSVNDIAVLQLDSAANLRTAALDEDDDLAVGDAVTAVGNSEGAGELQAAEGTVTALDASITAASESSGESNSLSGLIEVDADVVSGDSGGALLDEDGEVVGVNTAASTGGRDITGYAIDIDQALDIAQDIVDGEQTQTNTLGYPAFLGVSVQSAGVSSQQSAQPGSAYGSVPGSRAGIRGGGTSGSGKRIPGVTVAGVYEGTPAAEAGLGAGDTIVAVDGTAVTDGEQLSALLADHAPGDQVQLSWTDAAGAEQTATVTLAEGPAA
jgi:S1-C subfamily serine protease